MHKTQDKARHSIKTMCKVLYVSETGYYKWLKGHSRPYKYDELLAKIRQIRADNPDYGAHRIYLHLQIYQGYTGSYYLILKLCKTHQLMLKKKWRPKGITKADPAVQASANLIQQDFSEQHPIKNGWEILRKSRQRTVSSM